MRECEETEKYMAPPLELVVRPLKMHEVNETVDVRVPTGLLGVNVHLSYGGAMHSEVGLEEMCNEGIDRACFLTHSVKVELKEMKESFDLSVSPEQRRLLKISACT